jgi:hypothetical protein
MRRWLAVLVFLASFVSPVAVHAQAAPQTQNPVTIQSLEVDLWPEYDQPKVLVIYRMTLASTVKLPAEITVRLPVAAGNPSAVAEQTANGLFNLQYTTADRDANWQMFRFTTTLPQLQIEYYDPNLVKKSTLHSYTYQWPGDYAVAQMSVKVQQPRTASQMKLEPNMGTSSLGNDGLTYFEVPVGKVDGSQTFQLSISYQKSDEILSNSAAFSSVTPVGPTTPGAGASASLNQWLPWALASLGLLMIGGGVWWYLRTGRQSTANGPRRHARGAPPAPANGDAAIFCHQCGKKAAGGDVFCRVCGARLRR